MLGEMSVFIAFCVSKYLYIIHIIYFVYICWFIHVEWWTVFVNTLMFCVCVCDKEQLCPIIIWPSDIFRTWEFTVRVCVCAPMHLTRSSAQPCRRRHTVVWNRCSSVLFTATQSLTKWLIIYSDNYTFNWSLSAVCILSNGFTGWLQFDWCSQIYQNWCAHVIMRCFDVSTVLQSATLLIHIVWNDFRWYKIEYGVTAVTVSLDFEQTI